MAGNVDRKFKSSSGSGQDEWSVREKLILASAVLRRESGKKVVKTISESTFGVKPRPPDFFSDKNCAAQYSDMLEKVAAPKRKRTNETGGTETRGEQIVRTLTFERIDELKKLIKADQMKYRKLKSEIEMILSGKCDDRLPLILENLQNRPKPQMEPPTGYSLAQQREAMKNPQYPQPITPSTSPSVTGTVQQPLTSPVSPSPQKMKNLRVPKPTERFQKYQQQQQARHGHSASQSHQQQQQQQQQYKQQLNALEQLQKQQQLQQLQQHLQHQQQQQQQQMHQQQLQQQQQLQKPSIDPRLDITLVAPESKLSAMQDAVRAPQPQQFFRTNSQKDIILHQQQQQRLTPAVQQSFQSIPDKNHLTQLVQPGHNVVKKEHTTMDVDVSFDKKAKNKVNPNVKEALPVREAAVDNGIMTTVSISSHASTSSGLLSTLLTAPVNEIKHVAETINQVSYVDQEKSDVTSCDPISESSLSFLDGTNLSTDVQNQKSRIAVPSATEVAPTLSKLLTTTAPMNPKLQNSTETSHPTNKQEASLQETLSDNKESLAKEHFDKEFFDRPAIPPKVLVMSEEVKAKPEKRRPGRPRTRKPPKEAELLENDGDESLKEGAKSPDVLIKLEPDTDDGGDSDERIKKCEDSDDFKKEDKSELSVQSSFGSESVPDSPASQISQSGSDDLETLQAQKNWKKSIMLVWRAAANHKYANVFLHPVTDDEAPGYHNVIYRPMDLSTIKKNIESGVIRSTSGFQRDMMLMFQNALMYNSADHDVYRMAEEMREDVMEQIQSYIATQLMVQSDRESKMLRGHKTDVFHFSL